MGEAIPAANKIVLLSTPWPLYNRPSIQLGTLKAYLRSIYPDIQVEAHHVYLKLAESIGYRLYHEISKRTWLAETDRRPMIFGNPRYAESLNGGHVGKTRKFCQTVNQLTERQFSLTIDHSIDFGKQFK
jgi:hypothetical protein